MKRSVIIALACSICLPIKSAYALDDQWYIGIGGGASWLQPNPVKPGLGLSARQGVGGHLFFGRDLDDRSSAQATFYALGEAQLENDAELSQDDRIVPFNAADASILYRIYDTNDRRLRPSTLSLALYGRFALGFINRDTAVPLSNDAAVYFGAGGGAEMFFTKNLSLRLEGMYHDRDAASGSLQLVARFGGTRRLQNRPFTRPPAPSTGEVPPPSAPAPSASTLPPTPTLPQAPTVSAPAVPTPAIPTNQDSDGDSVPNAQDQCPGSKAGFPVRATGCALFDGVLSGVSFAQGTELLLPGATNQLDFLANVLKQYPQARVELHAHTDNQGTVRDQAILTRARLRTMGTYLVGKGIRSNRLVLRSFGGTRPLYDNATAEGRAANNRIEVIENNPQ